MATKRKIPNDQLQNDVDYERRLNEREKKAEEDGVRAKDKSEKTMQSKETVSDLCDTLRGSRLQTRQVKQQQHFIEKEIDKLVRNHKKELVAKDAHLEV